MKNTLTEFFKIVLQQSKIAQSKNEIPVAALIFNPNTFEIIAFDHNKELSNNDPTAHAEILVIRKSCHILKQKRLDGLSMITNMQPCNLCLEAIKSSRIKEVHYIFENKNPSRKNIKNPKLIQHKIEADNSIKNFFKIKRISNQ
ncbi:MAG: hypothetical protein CMI90_00765 [Pelagibacteraceae bacterium]|nr:hypothetical protein [Pelagibacteraceae bacterium]